MGMIADSTSALVNFVQWLRKQTSDTTASLTRYTNQVNILGKVYMEENIAQDDIAIPLMSTFNQMYVCWILCALGLDNMCADGHTVSERLMTVSGQSMALDDILEKVKASFGSRSIQAISNEGDGPVKGIDPDTQRLIVGRLIEFDFNSGAHVGGTPVDTRSSCKAYFYVSLYPYFIASQICKDFMGINFTQSLSTRFAKVRAGEISFWKDFVFARDILQKEKQLIKNDKTGVVAEMMSRQGKGPFRWAWGIVEKTVSGIGTSHNLANAILVFDRRSFDQSCREAHIDFSNEATRDKFFRKTWTMAVAVVDPMIQNVVMYFAGVPAVGLYSYAMINKVGAKGKDNFDLKEIMNAMSSGQVPRF